jgi:hypothetical protein
MHPINIYKLADSPVSDNTIRILVIGDVTKQQTILANSIGIGLRGKFPDLHIHDIKDPRFDPGEIDPEERNLSFLSVDHNAAIVQARSEALMRDLKIEIFTIPAKHQKIV